MTFARPFQWTLVLTAAFGVSVYFGLSAGNFAYAGRGGGGHEEHHEEEHHEEHHEGGHHEEEHHEEEHHEAEHHEEHEGDHGDFERHEAQHHEEHHNGPQHPFHPTDHHFANHDDHHDDHHWNHHRHDWQYAGWGWNPFWGGYGAGYYGDDWGGWGGNTYINNSTPASAYGNNIPANENANVAGNSDDNADQSNSSPQKLAVDVWPELGVSTYSGECNNTRGLVVVQVTPGSLADKAGIVAGDVILKLDGQPTADEDDMESALDSVHGQVRLSVLDGRTGRKNVVTGSLDNTSADEQNPG
jgi:hypothetical protein